jgi:hypothetical protein
MNLITRIDRLYGMASAKATEGILRGLGITTPRDGEYTTSWDSGFIVFLNYHACVIRLTAYEKLPYVDDPAMLQPLFRRNAGALRFDINPGLRSSVTPKDAMALADQMLERNIRLWDQKVENCGYLPPLRGQDRPIPVVLDPCAVQKLSDAAGAMRNVIQAKTKTVNLIQAFRDTTDTPLPDMDETLQTKLFAPLKRAFDAAWPEPGYLDTGLMMEAWKLCRHHHARGTLCAGWLTERMEKSGYKRAYEGSTEFAKRWRGPTKDLFPKAF